MSSMEFSRLQLHPHLLKNLQERGFQKSTPIQEATIPLALEGKDIIACARTGSGKTLSFLLPIYHQLLNACEQQSEEDTPKKTKVLVLCPTRELVLQIQEEAEKLSQGTSIVSLAVFGGTDYEKQKKALSYSPEIIVATPGRLLDYLRSKDADLSALSHVVLDEADRMLDMGFIDDVHNIMQQTASDRKVYLFSATLDYNVIYSMWEYMADVEEVLINPELVDHTKIAQSVLHLGRDEKLPYLIQHIESISADPIILFTNTRRYVDTLVENLNYHSVRARGLSGTVNQKKRIEILNAFKEKKFRVLVATDVASRGLHIEDVQLVVNYDIPEYPENYVHRIGRTARAGKSGEVLNLCSELDYDSLEKVESFLKHKLEIIQPEERFLENLSFVKIRDYALPLSHGSNNRKTRRQGQAGQTKKTALKKYQNQEKYEQRSSASTKEKRAKNNRKNTALHKQTAVRQETNFSRSSKATQKSVVTQNVPQYKSVLSPAHSQGKGFFARLFSWFGKNKKENSMREISARTKEIFEREAKQNCQAENSSARPQRSYNKKKKSARKTKSKNNHKKKG